MKRKPVVWIIGFLVLVSALLALSAAAVIRVDPYFHYHRPDTEAYAYPLYNQRSQNDGIVKHFSYTGLITGSSMTENFRATEAEALWGGTFIKVPFSGGSFREVNDLLWTAFRSQPDLKIVIRSLDMNYFLQDKDLVRTDLGTYPTYLYDDNPLNDAQYLFNREILFSKVWPIVKQSREEDFRGGVTSFDDYSRWMGPDQVFGKDTVNPEGYSVKPVGETAEADESMGTTVTGNVRQNICAVAEAHPEAAFLCFITPYSAAWWMETVESGRLEEQLEAERILIEEILAVPNIELYSFNTEIRLTGNLNFYKDPDHYGDWINSVILRWMRDGRYRLTRENYEAYLAEERQLYTAFDYASLGLQDDFENDADAAAQAEALYNSPSR